MRPATYTHHAARPSVVRLRVGRLVAGLALLAVLGGGAGLWLLTRYGHKAAPDKPAETLTQPSWMKQSSAYPLEVLPAPAIAATPPSPPDRSREILEELAKLWKETKATREEVTQQRQESLAQQKDIDELKRRPVATQPARGPQPTPNTAPPPRKLPPSSMLFITHEVKEGPPLPAAKEYTLAPGATKLPCIIETSINSDVEGYFTAKVSTNVFDTATGRHLLVPQGSTILGNTQSSKLVYGNERMDTVSLKLAFPDGRSVDLGRAPVTDEQGIAGLTQRVDQHYWRLLAAVLIQGVLRGGATAVSSAAAGAAGGQVITGVTSTGAQTGTTVVGPLLSTRPTIEVDAGKICNVLLLEPLLLPAMWQDGEPREQVQAKKGGIQR